MKVKYDVEVPRNTRGEAPYASAFWEFYDSEHQNAELEYETTEQAFKAQAAIGNLRNNHKIHDVIVTRRKNKLYLVRGNT